MPKIIPIKQGESLQMELTFTGGDEDQTPVDLTGYAVTSQVRDVNGFLVATLPITMTLAAGTGTVFVADTSSWPRGMLRCDVRVASASVTLFTETFSIQVNHGVTL